VSIEEYHERFKSIASSIARSYLVFSCFLLIGVVAVAVAFSVDHYEPYLDFDELLRRTQASNTSFNEPGTVNFDDLCRV
jgi:hypothetical protein